MRRSAAEAERKALEKSFPYLKRLTEARLRDMVIEVWARLWRESPYRDLAEAPNYLDEMDGEESLVRHTNAVTSMTLAAAREFQKAYHANINFDRLLAGALLHDADKLVLYEKQGRAVRLSELGRRVTHGEYGASIARELGLPEEIANMLACHSPFQDKFQPATIEAALLIGCDTANFQSFRLMTGKGSLKWH